MGTIATIRRSSSLDRIWRCKLATENDRFGSSSSSKDSTKALVNDILLGPGARLSKPHDAMSSARLFGAPLGSRRETSGKSTEPAE